MFWGDFFEVSGLGLYSADGVEQEVVFPLIIVINFLFFLFFKLSLFSFSITLV